MAVHGRDLRGAPGPGAGRRYQRVADGRVAELRANRPRFRFLRPTLFRRWNQFAHPGIEACVQTDVEIRAQGLRHLLPEEGTEAPPGYPPNEFTEQVAMGHGLVSALGARLPPGRLGGEQTGAFVPVVERFQCDWLLESRQPGHVAEQIAHGQLLFAGLGKLRPVLRHGVVQIDRAPVDEDQGRDGRHHLGGRVDIDDGVSLPGPGPRRIGMSRPEVHDRLAIHGCRKGRTDFPALPEVFGERIPDGDETRVAVPCHLDRCGHALSACAWPGRPRTRSPSSRQRSADALRTCRPCRTPRVRGRPRARS